MYLWSFPGYQNEKSLITPNEEYRSPLKATLLQQSQVELPVSRTGVTLSRKGVLVTSFGPNPFGSGIILRPLGTGRR